MTQTPDFAGAGGTPSSATLWVYGYELTLLGHEHRLTVRAAIARENRAARRSAGTWTARLIMVQPGAQVLIVSNSPDLDTDRNRRLESDLATLGIEFSVTAPMKVMEEPASGDC
jgi:hypothetical protein